MGYNFRSRERITVKKALEESIALRRLRNFLDRNEPQLVYFLVHTWRTQAKAITYKELREAILAGDITWSVLQEWQEDYAAFVRDHMKPKYEEAIRAAASNIEAKYKDWYFDPMGYGVQEWVNDRAASFVTEVSSTQIEGLRTVIQRAAVLETMTVDQLARAIRPMVGLTHPQAVANMNYFEKLVASGTKEERAKDLAARYAARQHRYRGYNIARTELAFAYNQGSFFGTLQAQDKGYMGDVVKVWSTAEDERVCPICGALAGTRVGMDEEFTYEEIDDAGNSRTRILNPKLSRIDTPSIGKVPPAHPGCRCAVMYKEITPPIATITQVEAPIGVTPAGNTAQLVRGQRTSTIGVPYE